MALIWWLNQESMESFNFSELNPPEYLQKEWKSRYGRPGRGRLWVADQFGGACVDPWPYTELANILADDYGGIVIEDEDVKYAIVGIVTDLQLNLIKCELLNFDEFVEAYIEGLLSIKNRGCRSKDFIKEDITPETMEIIKNDCKTLLSQNFNIPSGWSVKDLGKNFAQTRGRFAITCIDPIFHAAALKFDIFFLKESNSKLIGATC